jgi:phytoene synthase
MTPDAYCADRAARSGSSFYYAFRFLPPPQRRAITALYAFCREVDDVVDEVTDPAVARTKLAWWRGQIDAVYDAQPEHPVGRALVPVVRDHGLDRAHFHGIVDGMQMDLDWNRYPDFATLEVYCHRVAGLVGLLSAEIFGITQAATRAYARALGIALQLTNILRDVGEDARRNRIYVPLDEIAAAGLTVDDFILYRESDAMRTLLAQQAERAARWYDDAHAALPAADRRAQRTGLVMGAIYRRLLHEVRDEGAGVLNRRVSLTPMTKLWIAWRTWMRG